MSAISPRGPRHFGSCANPPTAWFAVFEVGIPSAIAGGLVGLVAGTVATGLLAYRSRDTVKGRADQRLETSRCPDVVVVLGALTLLDALRSMDWASRVDDLGRATFEEGPTGLAALAGLATLALSGILLLVPRRWPRWLLVATTLTTAVATVVVALSTIAAANDAGHGAARTSYEPGAVVAVAAAIIITACALIGFSSAYPRRDLRDVQTHSSPERSPGRSIPE